ncbi:glutathione S-transferase family protein [Hoeflea sp. YIM 152468]|uniref:glutathione S-transferase family protein n=1 Tax=Hoeflea sp. YIM 152468 TaxID=3031759 RepID=UPI0023DB5102|nr:glutathione S-transferase family protein [Hoeflea sp. YIM 152468]MDF1607212.1 glutathione S-transferase family protein [Hoeflea sp. YIM 152468]
MSIILHDLIGADPSRPFSPHCWKVAMALAHKGLPFERNKVSFTQVPEVEGGVFKTVPVIRDGNQVVGDSFLIAVYLEDSYPDRASLFAGQGGQAMARFIESWTNATLHATLRDIAMMGIHEGLAPVDQAYFRATREARMGMTLEQTAQGRDAALKALPGTLMPLRLMLKSQPWIGGASPLFADYIVFGALQWVRLTSPDTLLETGDPVAEWFERCLDLHDGLGRSVPARATLHRS